MKKSLVASLVIAGLCVASPLFASEHSHWGYSGHEGPEHWGELDAKYYECSHGKNQSPINLTGMVKSDLSPIVFNYKTGGTEVLNNGHTVQVNYQPGSTITVNGHEYELKQFHFHSPSENTIEGKSYDMEAHFVHVDKDGNLAVVAVMFNKGAKNAGLEKAWRHMPDHAGENHKLADNANAADLLPTKREYYRFNGSLTTPPCTEGVLWLVMKNPDTASSEQIQRFSHAIGCANNRPVQNCNARAVLQ